MVLSNMSDFSANLAAVLHRVERATVAAGRAPGSVALLAVTKTQPLDVVAAARRAGMARFGTNYVREGIAQIAAAPDAEWHYIGRLQSNKTRMVAERFAWVHTIDRISVARRLSAQRPVGEPLHACLQVNVDDEPAKGGAAPEDIAALAAHVADLPGLRLRGLMAIPRADRDPRPAFTRVRALFETLRADHPGLDTLSMGMSADLEAAIAEGATIVRVGTALFGARA